MAPCPGTLPKWSARSVRTERRSASGTMASASGCSDSRSTAPNITANPTPARLSARAAITVHDRPSRGNGRRVNPATASRTAPARSDRSAANHSTGASRRSHRMRTKQPPHVAVTMSTRAVLGCSSGALTGPVRSEAGVSRERTQPPTGRRVSSDRRPSPLHQLALHPGEHDRPDAGDVANSDHDHRDAAEALEER